MRARERLAKRNEAFFRLDEIDGQLRLAFVEKPTTRAASAARTLLDERAKFADRITGLGGQPGPAPVETPKEYAC